MTKAKSLVQIVVSEIFRDFPIDQERYELMVVLEEIAAGTVRDGDYYSTLDSRVQEWVLHLTTTLKRCTNSFVDSVTGLQDPPTRGDSAAARVMRSMDELADYSEGTGLPDFTSRVEVACALLKMIVGQLKSSPGSLH